MYVWIFLCAGLSFISIENASDEFVVRTWVEKEVQKCSKNPSSKLADSFSNNINDYPVHKHIQTYLS